MLNRVNRVLINQKHFQTADKTPLYLKGPRDRAYVVVAVAMVTVGVVGVTEGLFRMVRDKK
ncbi:hypothetical protein BC940DRAFT_309175 [Gongronella butleri]|nr:hypothetical protein BC940DRAFT_309175 [Gongronella butleri]